MSPRLRKTLIWTAIGLPVLLGLGWVVLSLVASSRLATALASLKDGGYATSLAELAPPPVPADRNGAPDYVAAFALLPEEESEALENAHEAPVADLSPEEKAAVLEILAKCGPLFEKIRSGRKRGACRYERDYARGLAMELPDIPGLMGASKLLRLRAQAEAAAGRTSEAREAVRDILALGEGYREEPLLVNHLVRFASLAVAVDAIQLCVTAETPEADLRAWLELLPPPESLDGAIERALRGELAVAAQLAVRPEEAQAAGVKSGWAAAWWKLSCARHLDSMRRVVGMSGKPYLEARSELDAYMNELLPKRGFLDMVSLLLLPATTRALDRQRIAQASLAVLRAGLSAELGAAVDVPDPLSGRPLLYRDGAVSSAGVPGAPPEDVEKERLTWKLRKK